MNMSSFSMYVTEQLTRHHSQCTWQNNEHVIILNVRDRTMNTSSFSMYETEQWTCHHSQCTWQNNEHVIILNVRDRTMNMSSFSMYVPEQWTRHHSQCTRQNNEHVIILNVRDRTMNTSSFSMYVTEQWTRHHSQCTRQNNEHVIILNVRDRTMNTSSFSMSVMADGYFPLLYLAAAQYVTEQWTHHHSQCQWWLLSIQNNSCPVTRSSTILLFFSWHHCSRGWVGHHFHFHCLLSFSHYVLCQQSQNSFYLLLFFSILLPLFLCHLMQSPIVISVFLASSSPPLSGHLLSLPGFHLPFLLKTLLHSNLHSHFNTCFSYQLYIGICQVFFVCRFSKDSMRDVVAA